MAPLPLTAGAYSAQSLLVSAQRCINLYPEKNPPDVHSPFPVALYPRPGLLLLSAPPVPGPGRCLYRATNGDLYAVIGQAVYFINQDFVFTQIGSLLTPATTPVSISDNGTQAVVVDNSMLGYVITLSTSINPLPTMAQIADINFSGGTRVDFIDTFLVFNKPGTNQWYSTTSGVVTPFNALFLGRKTAYPDNIVSLVTVEREAWLFGTQKSEVWYNAGTVPFPFQLLSGNIIEHGCAAPYSPQKMDTNVYWLSQSPEGDRMVMRGNSQNLAQRISNHAIEVEWRKYPTIADAIGSVYQIAGHSFYKLHFPTADKTWGYDEASGQWHEDNAMDNNGLLHRANNTFCAFAYGLNLGLDWSNGNLYQIDPQTFTDNAQPIPIIRSYPHVVNELKKISVAAFIADVETGETGQQFISPWSPGFNSGFGPLTAQNDGPELLFRYSKDGGHKFSNNRIKQLVSAGHYRSMQRFRNLGTGRDFVFELASTAQMITAIHGAYFDAVPSSA